MAKRVTIEIFDDTNGSPAEQTVPFGLDGVAYEIDLSTTNANALREALAPYVAAARRTGGRRIKVAVGQPTDSTKQEPEPRTIYTATHDIRTWARENGYEVADQGRISKTVIDGIPLISPAPQQGNQSEAPDRDCGEAAPHTTKMMLYQHRCTSEFS